MRAGEASATAQRVAAYRLGFDRAPAAFGDPSADDRLGRDVAGDVRVDRGSRMSAYLAGRTAFFDGVVVGASEAGITQVVVAAAGYDARSLRYARSGVRWFEVDHPGTQRDKLARLRRLGVDVGSVAYVPADFTVDDVAAALAAAGHDRGVPTLFLCEGVALYLDRDVLRTLLGSLGSRAAAGSRLAASLSVERTGDGLDGRRRRFRTAVAAMGEPVRSTITPDGAAELLAATGWREARAAGSSPGSSRARRAGFIVAEAV